jgi:ABC-type glycerol-3-phosphate transport system substrate-binding protein
MRVQCFQNRLVRLWRWWICLALAILAGCSPAAVPAADANALVVAVPRGGLSLALQGAAAAYSQEIGARVRIEAFGSDDYAAQINAALLAGLDRYDLVYLSADSLARWVENHAIRPLSGDLDRAALAAWLPAVMVKDQVYGLPAQPDPSVLWYRADLLESAGLGVPRDWAEFRRAAEALNAPPNHYGVTMSGIGVDAAADFAALLAGFGGQAVSAGYQVEFASEPARQALDFYAGLAREKPVVAPGAENATRAEVLAALREGRAALGFAPLSARGQLLDCKSSPKVCQSGKPLLAWAWLPGLDQYLQVGSLNAWVVPLKAAHADQAQRFAAWLGSEAGALAWAQAGGLPAHPAVLSGLKGVEGMAQVREFRLAFPQIATVDILWKASSNAVNAAVAGKQSPEKALETGADTMRIAIGQAGY